jgi:uncharacterized membrane protein YgcG
MKTLISALALLALASCAPGYYPDNSVEVYPGYYAGFHQDMHFHNFGGGHDFGGGGGHFGGGGGHR